MSVGPQPIVEKNHIAAIPGVCGGKPCISGTRIRVWDIHVWHDLQGMTPQEIVAEFPQLTVADVHAALTYYHDNREFLEEQNRQAESLANDLMGGDYSSKISGGADEDSVSSR